MISITQSVCLILLQNTYLTCIVVDEQITYIHHTWLARSIHKVVCVTSLQGNSKLGYMNMSVSSLNIVWKLLSPSPAALRNTLWGKDLVNQHPLVGCQPAQNDLISRAVVSLHASWECCEVQINLSLATTTGLT